MYAQILVPLDGSELAERALSHAQGLAKTHGATVHLLRVLTHHPSGGHSRGGGQTGDGAAGTRAGLAIGIPSDLGGSSSRSLELARQLLEAQLEEAQEYLEHMAARLKDEGIVVETELLEGEPHERIVEHAKQHGVDIIVMSTHGHGGIKRLIMGSTTDRVIRSGEAHVLVVT